MRWAIHPSACGRRGDIDGDAGGHADGGGGADHAGAADVRNEATLAVGCIGSATMYGGLLSHLHTVDLVEMHVYNSTSYKTHSRGGVGGDGGGHADQGGDGDGDEKVSNFATVVIDDVMRQHRVGVAAAAGQCLMVSRLTAGTMTFTPADLADPMGRASAVLEVALAVKNGREVSVTSYVLVDGWRMVPVVKYIQV